MAEPHEGLLVALGGLPSKGGKAKGADDEPEPDAEESLESQAATDILDAIRSKDKDALADALKTFVAKCMADYHSEDEEKPAEGE